MLTKTDLNQIRTVVDEVVDTKLEEKLDKKLKPIHKRLDSMEKTLNKKIDTVQKTLNTTIKYFDTVTTDHETRIKRVEKKVDAFPLVVAN